MSEDDAMQFDNELKQAEALLPWYLTGRLSAEEKLRVERQLQFSEALSRELESLKALRTAVVRSTDELAPPSGDGYTRLMARIDADEGAGEPGRAGRLWHRLTGLLQDASPLRLRPAYALVAAVILFQAVAIGGLVVERIASPRDYEIASPTDPVREFPTVLVAFRDELPAAALRQIVYDLDGNIVKGPTPEGVYVIEIRRPLEGPDQLDRIVEALRARGDAVRFAERGR